MIDVDQFKRVNDEFGHELGDAVLRALGRLLRGSSRASDIPCRYGGEEFLLILPEAEPTVAMERAELIRRAFREIAFELEGGPMGPVTLSLGVAAFPDHGRSVPELMRAADAALYWAKSQGRDQVSLAAGGRS